MIRALLRAHTPLPDHVAQELAHKRRHRQLRGARKEERYGGEGKKGRLAAREGEEAGDGCTARDACRAARPTPLRGC